MRKFLLIVASLVVVTAVAAAQHANVNEPAVKGTLMVNSDVLMGATVLPAGTYNYRCDRENITFSNPDTGKTVVKMACKGRELPTPSETTTMYVGNNASGKKIVTKLLLKGSNIEHVFQ